jgi:hypothetical protein
MYRGFIRSRGRLRQIRKPPETTKKKSIPLIGVGLYIALVLAIISIAYYLKAIVLRNAESGNNDSNSIARAIRAQEMHKQNAFSTYRNRGYSTAIASLQVYLIRREIRLIY